MLLCKHSIVSDSNFFLDLFLLWKSHKITFEVIYYPCYFNKLFLVTLKRLIEIVYFEYIHTNAKWDFSAICDFDFTEHNLFATLKSSPLNSDKEN